jgi:asparagine synthase (glutamine-hydrolysing)
MCAIAGAVVRSSGALPELQPLLTAMAHRGPDGQGLWTDMVDGGGAISLGHRRLSIIDLSAAASQPMADWSGRYQLVFNGEIYNYLELKNDLSRQGARFMTSSDSEVILEAYKAWGEACLDRLNGMFAFAIYDQLKAKLFCARDRYGEKPFLFSMKPECFAFASEYKALLLVPGVSADIDEFRLVNAAYNPSTGLDSDRETVFREIQQLLPGEALEIDAATLNMRVWRYYSPVAHVVHERMRETDVFAEFRDLLTDAVRIRMRSDVTVGSCLSGGLDSSAIVCLARGLIGDDAPYQTFTGRFPGTYADEFIYADVIVQATGVSNHTVEPTADRFIDELPNFIWHNELPVGSSSQFAQWCVFDLARAQGVTVLLDGQGADELLGGYEQYFADYIRSLQLCGETDRLAKELPLIRERYPLALVPPGRGFRDRLPLRIRHMLANQFGVGSSILYGMKLDVAEKVLRASARPVANSSNPLGEALCHDSFGGYLTTLLRYGDRNSMAHSREVRLPFCDYRLAEFVLGQPPHLLMGGAQTKRLLRESMRGVLPEGIRTRWNKQGFRPPQDQWFQSKRFLTIVRETLRSDSFRQSPWWMDGMWQKMLDRVDRGDLALGWTLWHPFIIEMWRRHFVDEAICLSTRPRSMAMA